MQGTPLTPIIIIAWLGFVICGGVILATRFGKNALKDRLRNTLNPQDTFNDEEILLSDEQDEMSRSLLARLLIPVIKRLGSGSKTNANNPNANQVGEMLEQAGHPMGMYYADFIGLKTFCLFVMLGIGVISCFFAVPFIVVNLLGQSSGNVQTDIIFKALWVFIFAYIGFSGPTFWLRFYLNKRMREIRKMMTDVVDLIVLALEAGLGFDQAVGEAVSKIKGPLSQELSRVLDEVRVGRQQSEAFRAMAARVRMPELSLLVAAIDQAIRMGTGLAHALRLQADEIRERRMAIVREKAGKLPVKMMLPLVFFIFPALFVVILGPAAIQFMRQGMM
ncbi:MAG: type II secretion system F family protein [Abditibacteriaceae bacterium]